MTNAIKWTPGQPPYVRYKKDYLIHCVRDGAEWLEILGSQANVKESLIIKAHAPINYPLTVNEAVHEHENSWHYWDLNGITRSTGYATREEAQAAYRDEYGDW